MGRGPEPGKTARKTGPRATARGWTRLEHLATLERARLVPVLGAGFAAQAFGELRAQSASSPRSFAHPSAALDWVSLLLGVFRAAGARHAESVLRLSRAAEGAATLVWDAAVTEMAEARGIRASAAERALRLLVRGVLDDAIDASARLAASALVDRFFSLGFEHTISFSFDRLLTPRAVHACARTTSIDLVGRRGQTNIWLPHGHASAPENILLGARAYGAALPALERAFAGLRARARRGVHVPRTWIDLAIERPLIFLGLSMGANEWTLWWTLAQRARRWARMAYTPPAFVLVRRDPSSDAFRALEASAQLVGLELLECDTWDAGWSRVRRSLAPR